MILAGSYFRKPRLFGMMGAVSAQYTFKIAVLFLPIIAGCDRAGTSQTSVSNGPAPSTSSTEVTEDMVARVNGKPIYAKEIAALTESADVKLSPKDALEILIRNKLLAEEARRRGFATAKELEVIEKDTLVRALLNAQAGEGLTAETIPPDRLQRCYDARKKEYDHPALRRVVHFLVRTDKKQLSLAEARTIAEKARAAALQATDEADFVQRVKPFTDEGGKNVITESLPPFASDNQRFVRAFVDATFALSKVGDISPSTKTDFGIHVIFLAAEIPAVHRSLDEVKAEVATACLPEVRREKAAEIITTLYNRNKIFIYEDALKSGRFPL